MNDFIRKERQALVKEAVYLLRQAKYSTRRKMPPEVIQSLQELETLFNQINRNSRTSLSFEQIDKPLQTAHAYLELLESVPCAR